jgi:hypothetical protein
MIKVMMLTSVAAGLSASLLAISGAWLGFRTLEPQFERVNELLSAMPSADLSQEP